MPLIFGLILMAVCVVNIILIRNAYRSGVIDGYNCADDPDNPKNVVARDILGIKEEDYDEADYWKMGKRDDVK